MMGSDPAPGQTPPRARPRFGICGHSRRKIELETILYINANLLYPDISILFLLLVMGPDDWNHRLLVFGRRGCEKGIVLRSIALK